VRLITELCGLRVSMESYLASKCPMQCKRCQRFENTQRNCGYAPRCVAYGGSNLSGRCPNPREKPQCCGCGSKLTASYRGLVKSKEAKAALAKQAPQRAPRSAATGHPADPKAQQAGPSAEHLALGEGWSHVFRGGRVAKATATTPAHYPNPPPQPVTEVPRQPKVTATRKKAGPKKPELKPTAAAQPAAGKSKKKVAASVKTAATKPATPVMVVPTNPLEEISDLLDRLPLHACVELTRLLPKSISSLPTWTARPRVVL